MRGLRRIIACLGLALSLGSAASAQPAPAPAAVAVIDGPTYVTAYVEVLPSTVPQALTILKAYRAASLKETGATFIDIYQEQGQSHRFVIGEVWTNRAAVAEHAKSQSTAALESALGAIALGPIDTRIHQAYAATPPKAPRANDVILISHIDVAGGNTRNLGSFLDVLGEASRKDPGMVRFEILDEVPAHANHFRLIEEWENRAAWEAHDRAAHTQAYRKGVVQMLGTPYDQRLYNLAN